MTPNGYIFTVVLGVAVFAQSPSFAQQAPAAAARPAGKAAALAAKPPASAPDTIMFTIDELTEIRSRSSAGAQEETSAGPGNAIESATLYLSTIMYSGPNDWTVWVNGQAISPGQEFQAFKISEIKPSYVEIMVPLSAMGMRPVRLSPNQTFVVKTGAVVEGPWR